MKKNDTALKKFIEKAFTSESKAARVPIYLFMICLLLIGIFIELIFIGGFVVRSVKGKETFSYTSNDPFEAFYESTSSAAVPVPETTNAFPSETTEQQNSETTQAATSANSAVYVINKNSKKIHYADCSYASNIKDENKLVIQVTYAELQNQYLSNGYVFCSKCAER